MSEDLLNSPTAMLMTASGRRTWGLCGRRPGRKSWAQAQACLADGSGKELAAMFGKTPAAGHVIE